jgi:hypothetical protein
MMAMGKETVDSGATRAARKGTSPVESPLPCPDGTAKCLCPQPTSEIVQKGVVCDIHARNLISLDGSFGFTRDKASQKLATSMTP